MKLVYVAGPYSADNGYEEKLNTAKAEALAVEVWKTKKAAAICPHLNTCGWQKLFTHEEFLAGDLEMVRRCDAVLMVPGWEESRGAVQERTFAFSRDMPVFYAIEGLKQWMDSGNYSRDLQIPSGTVLTDGWHPGVEVRHEF